MASTTLGVGQTFPDGTTVGAYPASAWSGRFASGTPLGSATDSQSVSNGSVAFTGLTEDTDYYAAGSVSGTYRYVLFHVPADAETGATASISANVSVASTTFADVSGLSLTKEVTGPVEVKFSCGSASNNTANAGVAIKILEDGALVGGAQTFFTVANLAVPMSRIIPLDPARGTRTYKVQLAAVFAGTATLKADDNTSLGRCTLSVVDV